MPQEINCHPVKMEKESHFGLQMVLTLGFMTQHKTEGGCLVYGAISK